MIRVMYAAEDTRLTVEGHAGSGVAGRDLVCAAASALAVTLAEAVTALEAAGRVRAARTELERGRAEISCVPRGGEREGVQAVFDAICRGFAWLGRQYPEYVSLELW